MATNESGSVSSLSDSTGAVVCPRCATEWRPRTRVEMLAVAKALAIQEILDDAEEIFSLTPADLRRKFKGMGGRGPGMCWVARELRSLGLTLMEVGELMGGRHHSSVIYLIRKADNYTYQYQSANEVAHSEPSRV